MIHRLELQSRSNQTNDANETLPGPRWSTVTKCWARITPVSGNEYEQANAQQAKISHVIDIWNIKNKTDQIRSSFRFYDSRDGAVYNISGYRKQMIQRDRIISCQCIQDESRNNVEDA